MSFADTERRANILIAYPYWKDEISQTLAANASKVRLVIDSGAFTAWKVKKPIKLDDYCRFIETLKVKPWRYFTLDVIGDAHGTLKNYETMRDRGFTPVPIFTRGEDPSILDHYYQTSDLVGIGGLVGTSGNSGFVNGIMKRVAGRKAHWLGFTNLEFIKQYRPYMCDASTWETGGRYARIRLYMGNGQSTQIGKTDFLKPPPAAVVARMRYFGFEPSTFAQTAAWHGGESPNRLLSVASALAYSLDIQAQTGTLMFNAIADTGRGVRWFIAALDRIEKQQQQLRRVACSA